MAKAEPLCQYMYGTSVRPNGPRCLNTLGVHGYYSAIKHGFVREAFACDHTVDGKRCGVQQMHPCHDPEYGGTHMFTTRLKEQPCPTCNGLGFITSAVGANCCPYCKSDPKKGSRDTAAQAIHTAMAVFIKRLRDEAARQKARDNHTFVDLNRLADELEDELSQSGKN